MTKIFQVMLDLRLLPQKITPRLLNLEPYFRAKGVSNFQLRRDVHGINHPNQVCHRPSCRTSTHSQTISKTSHPRKQTKTRKKPPRSLSLPSKKTTNSKTSPSK